MSNWKEKQYLIEIQTSNLLEKFNPYHDTGGRFTTADNNSTGQGGGGKVKGSYRGRGKAKGDIERRLASAEKRLEATKNLDVGVASHDKKGLAQLDQKAGEIKLAISAGNEPEKILGKIKDLERATKKYRLRHHIRGAFT